MESPAMTDPPTEAGPDARPEAGWLERHGSSIVLAVAWTAMLGSLYFSEVLHYLPCRLCWFQRILMYPIALIALVGILRNDRGAPLYVLPLSLLGILVSSYHILIQNGFLSESTACQAGVPCAGRYINWLGFVTIPVLALTAFLLISFAGSAALRAPGLDHPRSERLRRVGLIIGIIVTFFALLWLRATA